MIAWPKSSSKVDILGDDDARETCWDISAGFTRLLAMQVQQYQAHIELLAIRSARERVLAAYEAGYLATTIPELGSRINLTPEACYRALRALCDDGRMRRISRGRYALQ